VEQNSSWEADSSPAGQSMPSLLRNP